MESEFLIKQLEKLYNLIFKKKHSQYVDKVKIIEVIPPSKEGVFETHWWTIKVAITLKEEAQQELYQIYSRLQGNREKVDYETYLKKGTLKNLFIDDVLKTDVYNDLTEIAHYVDPTIFVIHPIVIL